MTDFAIFSLWYKIPGRICHSSLLWADWQGKPRHSPCKWTGWQLLKYHRCCYFLYLMLFRGIFVTAYHHDLTNRKNPSQSMAMNWMTNDSINLVFAGYYFALFRLLNIWPWSDLPPFIFMDWMTGRTPSQSTEWTEWQILTSFIWCYVSCT